MKQIINIHADDYGINNEISDNIINSINNGLTNSISIICNTRYFIENVKKLEYLNKNIRKSLHLNLIEGSPISNKSEIGMILNGHGQFKYSFITLWLKYLFLSKHQKEIISKQIATEIRNQIKMYSKYCINDENLFIDSHMHLHMIPFIFDIIMDLSKEHKIKFIRIPYELNYFNYYDIHRFFHINLIKNILLNYLSKKNSLKMKKNNINRNEYFIGVLSTGNMHTNDIELALKKIKNKRKPHSIDILFHPGGVKNHKTIKWTNKDTFHNFYSSQNRDKELNILKSNALKGLIEKYETIFNN